ncbi:MAG: hypothetical protein HUJ25_06140 [Crocinitomicaceae bacterium]|nr:hypothetical protein [Crocinitomicaceae bacterium]
MPGWKRVLTILVIVLGPGLVIWYLATHLKNKFVELPYLGEWHYTYDADSTKIDSTAFVLPDFSLTRFDGAPITRDSIKDKFIVLSTLQPGCPEMEECGMSFYHFNEIFFEKLLKNRDNYSNVRVLSVLTDKNGNPIAEGPSKKLVEEMAAYDTQFWWMTYGDPTPLFSWEYYGKNFMKHKSTPEVGEIGTRAFTNSLVLIDRDGHIRGVTGAKRDSDIRNFFDLLKILKKEEFDENWAKEHPEG